MSGALQSELAKLASLPSGETLTPERLGELVGVRHGETQWDWREAVLNGETGRAIAVLLTVLGQPGVSGVRLVTQLGTALVGLGITRTLYDKGLRGPKLEDAGIDGSAAPPPPVAPGQERREERHALLGDRIAEAVHRASEANRDAECPGAHLVRIPGPGERRECRGDEGDRDPAVARGPAPGQAAQRQAEGDEQGADDRRAPNSITNAEIPALNAIANNAVCVSVRWPPRRLGSRFPRVSR